MKEIFRYFIEERQVKRMDGSILVQYVDRVYGYAVKRTYSREEANELSQEILFTALREIPKLRDDGRFEPWLWGLAGNVAKSFRRRMGRQRAMYSYNTLEEWEERACNYMFLAHYATVICGTAQKKGLMEIPGQSSICDVLIQFKKK